MLCVTASNNILENANHCEEDIAVYFLSSSAVYFYQYVYQKLCLRCQVPSREGLYEWDMLPIKIFKKTKINGVQIKINK